MTDKQDDRDGGNDRREHTRYDTSVTVDYANGETFLFAYLKDISEMGIFIRTEDPLAIGSRLRLRFHIDDADPLVLDGEVTWINPMRTDGENINPGMGVRFVRLTLELREQMVALVRTVAYLRD